MGKGRIHVYSGNGKGKTTAALGLCLRACGAGFNVFFAQFLKKGDYSEASGLAMLFPEVEFNQYGSGEFLNKDNFENEKKFAVEGFIHARREILSGKYDLAVFDEIIFSVNSNLIDEEKLLFLMDEKPKNLELVFTGRGITDSILKKADLVTMMEEKKHYFSKGVSARKGIEF